MFRCASCGKHVFSTRRSPRGDSSNIDSWVGGEIGDDRERFGGQTQNLQCLAGTAPVAKRSGKNVAREQFSRSASPQVAAQPFGVPIHEYLTCPWDRS